MGKRVRDQKQAAAKQDREIYRARILPVVISAALAALCAAFGFSVVGKHVEGSSLLQRDGTPVAPGTQTLIESLLVAPVLPADAEVALLNLASAPGKASSTKCPDVRESLKTLDRWAAVIAEQTWQNLPRYQREPKEFGSEAEWRLAMMCTVLGQDFKIRYDPALTSTDRQTGSNPKFFANPDSVFLSGCLNESRIGTCASLPVLYVAIGRRLGYPMHLVAAKGHLFARWDDGKETRVNLESANAGGFTSHPDSYYRSWPQPLTPQEEQSGGYLQNLSSAQTLAIFLSTRAACLEAAGNSGEAITAASTAFRLAPTLGGIAEALRAAIAAASQPDPAELQYQQWLAQRRAIPDPMDPTPHIQVPGMQISPSVPMIPLPGTQPFLPPPGPRASNPYSPR